MDVWGVWNIGNEATSFDIDIDFFDVLGLWIEYTAIFWISDCYTRSSYFIAKPFWNGAQMVLLWGPLKCYHGLIFRNSWAQLHRVVSATYLWRWRSSRRIIMDTLRNRSVFIFMNLVWSRNHFGLQLGENQDLTESILEVWWRILLIIRPVIFLSGTWLFRLRAWFSWFWRSYRNFDARLVQRIEDIIFEVLRVSIVDFYEMLFAAQHCQFDLLAVILFPSIWRFWWFHYKIKTFICY